MIEWINKLSFSWPKRIKRSGTFFMIWTIILFYVTSITLSGIFLLLKNIYGWDDVQSEHPVIFFLALMLVCSVVGNVIAWTIGNPSIRNLESLTKTANQIKQGDFKARAESGRNSLLHNFTNNFNSMAEELEGVETLRSDFVNSFSHEIKTPIVSIRGFAQELKNNDVSEEERQLYLDTIIREADRLSKMATNVLNLSRVEQQNILSVQEDFNLGEQLRQAVLLVMDKIEKKNIDLDVEIDDVVIRGNEQLMEQVWINLIDNAIKFTPEGGYLGVKLTRELHSIKAVIADSGCGIPIEDQPFIFEKFYQVKKGKTATGNGIGLTLVKKIVNLHGGRISCISNEGEGTQMIIYMNNYR